MIDRNDIQLSTIVKREHFRPIWTPRGLQRLHILMNYKFHDHSPILKWRAVLASRRASHALISSKIFKNGMNPGEASMLSLRGQSLVDLSVRHSI